MTEQRATYNLGDEPATEARPPKNIRTIYSELWSRAAQILADQPEQFTELLNERQAQAMVEAIKRKFPDLLPNT